MPGKNNLSLYQKLAKNKGGKCLSTEYVGFMSKLKFQCRFGHIWETNAVNISGKDRWCPFCAPNKKLSLQNAIDFAQKFDGYCLSTEYTNCITKMKWKCKYGHEWDSTLVSTMNSKGWCPQCTGKFFSENIVRRIFELATGKKFPKKKPKWLRFNNSILELDGYCEELGIAFEHQGIQHYEITSFSDQKTLDKIQSRDNIKRILCDENGVKLIEIPDVFKKIGIDDLTDFILQNLEKLNISIKTSEISIDDILLEERRQPSADKANEILEFVKTKNGECLTPYISYNIKLKFRCEHGHEWLAKWNNVKFGTWCPVCYKMSRGIDV